MKYILHLPIPVQPDPNPAEISSQADTFYPAYMFLFSHWAQFIIHLLTPTLLEQRCFPKIHKKNSLFKNFSLSTVYFEASEKILFK